jgi:hypothetical protein
MTCLQNFTSRRGHAISSLDSRARKFFFLLRSRAEVGKREERTWTEKRSDDESHEYVEKLIKEEEELKCSPNLKSYHPFYTDFIAQSRLITATQQ